MGVTIDATLAYGYDLGSAGHGKTAGPLPAGPDGDSPPSCWDLNELVESAIPDSDPSRGDPVEEYFGVRFDEYNTYEAPGLVLVVADSAVAAYHDPRAVDLESLVAARTADWDAKLGAALAVVGIIATQPEARRLVYPYYGGY